MLDEAGVVSGELLLKNTMSYLIVFENLKSRETPWYYGTISFQRAYVAYIPIQL